MSERFKTQDERLCDYGWRSNGAEEGSSIDAKTAQDELEKITLLVDEATTKKEKIEATIELRKAKARLQAVA